MLFTEVKNAFFVLRLALVDSKEDDLHLAKAFSFFCLRVEIKLELELELSKA